jgi:hypothetical protein
MKKRIKRRHEVRKWMRDEVIARVGANCVYCGAETSLMVTDHIDPVSRGGVHTVKNMVPACWVCNAEKSNKTFDEYLFYHRLKKRDFSFQFARISREKHKRDWICVYSPNSSFRIFRTLDDHPLADSQAPDHDQRKLGKWIERHRAIFDAIDPCKLKPLQ